jgi:hypothetical protein
LPSTSLDVLRCHRCGGRREVLALITEGTVVRAILECLGLPGAVLRQGDRRRARS